MWKYNGISEENIGNTTKSDSNFAPTFFDHHILTDTNFNGLCLNNIYIPKKVINIYNSYELNSSVGNLNTDFTLNNCLFGSVKLTKIQINTNIVDAVQDLILIQNVHYQMEA